jgi:DNA-binding transcriptional regulator LsrR (DeoR family)
LQQQSDQLQQQSDQLQQKNEQLKKSVRLFLKSGMTKEEIAKNLDISVDEIQRYQLE